VAFSRAEQVITVAARLAARLERDGGFGGAVITLPAGSWTNVLTGQAVPSDERGATQLADLLSRLPVALLVRQ
jgi:(1->4)-alpha-D-glucan 1-alpha-D-glucosylmutase